MKTLFWITILFAIAVGLAVMNQFYGGMMVIVVGNLQVVDGQSFIANPHQIKANLNVFLLACIALFVLFYLVFRLLRTVWLSPSHLRAARLRSARRALNLSALSFIEGRFSSSFKQAKKALKREHNAHYKMLGLMLSASSAEQMQNYSERDECLLEAKRLPKKLQLSRLLFEAKLFLKGGELTESRQALDGALSLQPNLVRALDLDLQLSTEEGDAEKIISLTEKLSKTDAIDEKIANNFKLGAYRQQLTYLTTEKEIKKWVKSVPNSLISEYLVDDIVAKYHRLGLSDAVMDWVLRYYPINKHQVLLSTLVKSVDDLEPAKQQKILEQGEAWLKEHSADDAVLLLCLGKIAYASQLWGKAQSYLEASISLEPSLTAHFVLAKLFNEVDKKEQAKAQISKALALAEKISEETSI